MQDLNDLMEIDHVIRVRNGVASSEGIANRRELWAPSLTWSGDTHHLDGEGWTLMDGYSGQDRYSGPIMHSSEYVGGHMAEDILARDGYYVAIVCEVLDDPDWDYSVENPEPAGWAVAWRPLELPD